MRASRRSFPNGFDPLLSTRFSKITQWHTIRLLAKGPSSWVRRNAVAETLLETHGTSENKHIDNSALGKPLLRSRRSPDAVYGHAMHFLRSTKDEGSPCSVVQTIGEGRSLALDIDLQLSHSCSATLAPANCFTPRGDRMSGVLILRFHKAISASLPTTLCRGARHSQPCRAATCTLHLFPTLARLPTHPRFADREFSVTAPISRSR